jgi:ribonucleotide reductase alpha subunit
VAHASPFIACKERALVTFMVKRQKWERMKEERKKSGLGHGHLLPYPVGTVFL